MADGTEPIDPDEIIYRRVPIGSVYKPNRNPALSQKAFSPRNCDSDGVSVIRAKFLNGPRDAAAEGCLGMEFYVIEFRAGDLQGAGATIMPDPELDCVGHALVTNINAANRDLSETQSLMQRCRNLTYRAHGPFPGNKPMRLA